MHVERIGGGPVVDESRAADILTTATAAAGFDEFYRREFPAMVALAATMSGSNAGAEDLAQEAMLRAHRKWSHVSDHDKPGAWLRRVTINLATSRARRVRVEAKVRLRLLGRGLSTLPTPPEEHLGLWQAVATLSPNQRAAIALRYLDGLSNDEIADILDCSASTARVHVHRAHKRLEELLGDDAGVCGGQNR